MTGKIVSKDEWLVARKELLEKEKAATKASDRFNETLRDFPMVKLDKEYTFEGPNGKATLSDLFEGRRQLIVYHFMLAPDDTVGCSGCSFFVDNLPSSLAHLHARSTSLVLISRAPLGKIEAFKKRMGWTFPWYSSFETDFNYDFHVSFDGSAGSSEYNFAPVAPDTNGERPGMSVFYKDGEGLSHSYSAYARGLDHLLVTYSLLDLTPLGRQEDDTDWKLHDEYNEEDTKASTE